MTSTPHTKKTKLTAEQVKAAALEAIGNMISKQDGSYDKSGFVKKVLFKVRSEFLSKLSQLESEADGEDGFPCKKCGGGGGFRKGWLCNDCFGDDRNDRQASDE